MLKHIPTGQPSSAVSRHHNDHQQQQQQQQQHPPHNQQQAHQQAPPSGASTQTNPSSLNNHHHHHHHHQHFTATSTASPSNRIAGNVRNSNDVYESVAHPTQRIGGTTAAGGNNGQSHQPTPSSTHRHPLNHSQLSVNNLSQRLNHSHNLNLSTRSTSKHSIDSSSPVVGSTNNNNNNNGLHHTTISHIPTQVGHERERNHQANGGLDVSRLSRLPSQTTPSPAPVPVHAAMATATATVAPVFQLVQPSGSSVLRFNTSWSSSISNNNNKTGGLPGLGNPNDQQEPGVKEMLTFLGLLCLVSLLLAMLSHIFLLKISPLTVTPSSLISPEEYTIVYEVTLALCALALSLNLCCLLVCAIQFLFAVKLVKSSYHAHRTNKYLQKSSISRVCAVGGFFVSIPVFLTGMILYTFIQFHSTPAIVMSVFIGLGIVFCGCAMVHNVFVWQREKTNAVKALARAQCEAAVQLQRQQQQMQQQQQAGGRCAGPIHRGGCATSPKVAGPTGVYSTTTLQHQHQQSQQQHHGRGVSTAYQQHHHHHQQQQQQQQLQLQFHQQQQQQQQQQQYHHHRRVRMSPPLLLSCSSGVAATHNHTGALSPDGNHRNLATPMTTPGNLSPPSPTNKHNRSQLHHSQREASRSVSPGLPQATLDLSSAATTSSPHELSTLV